jgi:exopolysaccharide biosynthesis polyprenyl glycosylphosphotransferase
MLKKLRENQRISNMLFGTLDIFIIAIVFIISMQLTNVFTIHNINPNSEVAFIFVLCLLIWVVLLKITHLARIPRTSSYTIIFIDFLKLSIAGGLILLFLDWVIKLDTFPSIAILIFAGLNFLVLYALRILTFKFFKIYRASGHHTRNIILLAGEDSDNIIKKIIAQKEWGFRIICVISDSEKIRNAFSDKLKIYPSSVNIRSLMYYDIIDELICYDYPLEEQKLYHLLELCSQIGVIFRINTRKKIRTKNKSRIYYFDKIPFFTVETSPRNSFGHVIKYTLEITVAFILLFFLSLVLLLISFAIITTSGRPVIFKQKRVGIRGRKFYIYKFRTMVQNAEDLMNELKSKNESDGPAFKIKKDPRITPVGRILRKTGLDELPQLFNVIKGEMSIIGPRPPLPSEVEKYEQWQMKRLSVKPGITCTWQILPNRNDVRFENWMQLDIQYIETWSLKNDLRLFFKTFGSIISARGY